MNLLIVFCLYLFMSIGASSCQTTGELQTMDEIISSMPEQAKKPTRFAEVNKKEIYYYIKKPTCKLVRACDEEATIEEQNRDVRIQRVYKISKANHIIEK